MIQAWGGGMTVILSSDVRQSINADAASKIKKMIPTLNVNVATDGNQADMRDITAFHISQP